MLWQAIAGLLAISLVWVILRQRREAKSAVAESWRIAAEDALKVIVKLELDDRCVDVSSMSANLGMSDSLAEEVVRVLVALGWIQSDISECLRLTDRGRSRGWEPIRAHRLWEQYLVQREGMSLEAVHGEAHRREHTATPEQTAELDAELGHPVRDPHGHVIPNAGSRVPQSGGTLLIECPVGERVRVLDIADEPPALLAQLLAMGLTPGAEVEIVERKSDWLSVKVNDRTVPVVTPAARRVHVAPVPVLPIPLGELWPGSRARVVEVTGDGKHQRRMLDMGLVPGAEVSVVRTAPLGDPVQYSVKGTAISMRRSDARTVLVEQETGPQDD